MASDEGDGPQLKFGRYEIIRELGKGAMGIVYLAKDPLIGRLVALKTIRISPNIDDEELREFQQRFMREAQAAGILSHPNIVTVHDIGTEEESGNSFIAMEYVEGRNLKEILNQGRPFSADDSAEVISQIAEALAFAHRKGIIHRDVKPANIIICDGNLAKITDFGIAKIASSVGNLTTTGQFLGTPNYMAPEQVKGTAVDGRADIFSLGVVLFESLTRQKPFGGDSLTTISYRIVHENFTPPSELDPRIPEAFDGVVEKCLRKSPADRYQSGSELAADLRAILLDEKPLIAGSVSISQSEGTMLDRTPTDKAGEKRGKVASKPSGQDGDEDEDLTDVVGESPVWKKKVRTTTAATIIGTLLALLIISSLAIWAERADVPPVDTQLEASVAKQRELRLEGQRLLDQGNIDAAYETYFELRKLAPNSREVGRVLRNLETLRSMRMSHSQRQSEALQHLEEGRRLYQQKRYSQAIPFFEQAFHLDDTLTSAVNYLRMSREQLSLQQMRSQETGQSPEVARSGVNTSVASDGGESGPQPVTLLTMFDSPVADGYFVVNVDGETVVHEQLYEERWGFLKRRGSKQVSVYRQIPADVEEIEVWVVVPSINLQEKQTIKPDLDPGALHRLIVVQQAAEMHVDRSRHVAGAQPLARLGLLAAEPAGRARVDDLLVAQLDRARHL
ncbi:MAG: protein kinase, partial [Acidobacteria bacterium]|nr:protein kinase [Acidobacteriota bacterium]